MFDWYYKSGNGLVHPVRPSRNYNPDRYGTTACGLLIMLVEDFADRSKVAAVLPLQPDVATQVAASVTCWVCLAANP